MKSLLIVFGALLLLITLPSIFTAIDNALTESTTQAFAGVNATDNGTVILGRALYNDEAQSVSSVTSNLSGDSPTAYSYNSASRGLVVSGLTTGTRTLTVAFLIDSTTLPTGAGTFLTVLRWFWIFAIIGMVGGAIYAFFD